MQLLFFCFIKLITIISSPTARKTQCGFIILDEGGHTLLNQQSEHINELFSERQGNCSLVHLLAGCASLPIGWMLVCICVHSHLFIPFTLSTLHCSDSTTRSLNHTVDRVLGISASHHHVVLICM